MISKLHDRLGTAGFVIAIVALVVALSGGAYAATGSLTGKQKKEVEKIAKKYAGKNGAPGAPGGPGAKGDPGAAGAAGGAGKEGQSGPAGKEGQPGTNGSPWTVGGTLPSNATETGVWGDTLAGPAGNHSYPISFTIPLASAPEPVLVKYVETEVAGKCPGRGENGSPPEAEPGFLCVYVMAEETHVEPSQAFRGKFVDNGGEWEILEGASPEGTSVWSTCSAICAFAGSWAVTAP